MISLLEGNKTPTDVIFLMFRVVESLCRSLNNLLEHLHQSFFFYFVLSPNGKSLIEPGRFVSIGTYLPAAMILAASFTITAISLWIGYSTTEQASVAVAEKNQTGVQVQTSSKPINFPLGVVVVLHGLGVIVFTCFGSVQKLRLPGVSVALTSSYLTCSRESPSSVARCGY